MHKAKRLRYVRTTNRKLQFVTRLSAIVVREAGTDNGTNNTKARIESGTDNGTNKKKARIEAGTDNGTNNKKARIEAGTEEKKEKKFQATKANRKAAHIDISDSEIADTMGDHLESGEPKEKRKTMILSETGQDYHEPSRSAKVVSGLSQAAEPGRNTLRNAHAAGFGNFEVVDTAYADSFSIDKAEDGSPGQWQALPCNDKNCRAGQLLLSFTSLGWVLLGTIRLSLHIQRKKISGRKYALFVTTVFLWHGLTS